MLGLEFVGDHCQLTNYVEVAKKQTPDHIEEEC